MNVLFVCPSCEAPARASLDAPNDWRCSACGHAIHFEPPKVPLEACVLCGTHDLYKQKDFPHRLGLVLLIAAFVTSIYTYLWYDKWLTWAILVGTALFDGALYLLVGDAVVCYRCAAHHRGLPPSTVGPFEITVGERYRQERLRVERQAKDR